MFIKRLFQTDKLGFILSGLLIISQLAYYFWRINRIELIESFREGLIPIMLLWLLLVLFTIGATFFYTFFKKKSLLLFLVMILGGILAVDAPLLPSITEMYFNRYRTDYEAVVILAKQKQLPHEGLCIGNSNFSPPEKYKHLTRDCIFVYFEPAINVSFSATTRPLFITYDEAQNPVKSYSDWEIIKKLDTHWYIYLSSRD